VTRLSFIECRHLERGGAELMPAAPEPTPPICALCGKPMEGQDARDWEGIEGAPAHEECIEDAKRPEFWGRAPGPPSSREPRQN
jgi:hypothetical protein